MSGSRHGSALSEWNSLIGFLKRGKNRLIAIKPGGTDDITASHVAWEKTKGLPYVPSPLLYRRALFMIKYGGPASCFDATTGAPHHEKQHLGLTGSFHASPVAATGRIYLVNLEGKAATLTSGPKPDILWQTDFKERIAATPAIADDTLYLRTETKMFAFKERR